MTAKIKNNVNDNNKSAFAIDTAFKSSTRPGTIELHFKNLKTRTKYKVFLTNSDGNRVEDITPFCNPYGESIAYNNESDTFFEFISTESGELFIEAKPFGVDSVNLNNDNWNEQWSFSKNKTLSNDVGRQNFTIIESAKVTSPGSSDKIKPISAVKPPIFTLPILPGNKPIVDVKQFFNADYIQTFFIDPNLLNGSKTVDITDITLFVRNKPNVNMNRSLRKGPGFTVCIVDTNGTDPVLNKQYKNSLKSLSWSEIQVSSDASTGTIIEFDTPVRLQAGRLYGIAIAIDDPDYVFWSHEKGHVLVNSNETSVGSRREFRGTFFTKTNASVVLNNNNFDVVFTEKETVDLKFDIHAAEYDISDPVNIHFVNIDQEFIVVSNTTDNWVGSEYVYKETANATGNVAIGAANTVLIGSGTNFITDIAKGDRILVTNGVNSQVLEIEGIQGATRATLKNRAKFSMGGANYKVTAIGRVDYYDIDSKLLVLRESNANASVRFTANDVIKGIQSGEEATITTVGGLAISVFNTDMDAAIPSQFKVDASYVFANTNGGSYELSNTVNELKLFEPNYVDNYDALILSKSIEAEYSVDLYDEDNFGNTAGKSSKFTLTFDYDGINGKVYETPYVDVSKLSVATKQWSINNDATNEHTNYGNAKTKHISKKLQFANGAAAEDIRIIQNAYKPIGTDVRVYAKILNAEDSESFDSKSWTELELVTGRNEFSDSQNKDDYREYQYSFPSIIPEANTIDGTITTELSNNIITGDGTTFNTDLVVGDVIRIYSEFFEDNYGYFVVNAIGSDTSLTIHEPISNNDLVGSSFKISKVLTPKTAYRNPLNLNIVRYFGENGEVYDGYSTVAIKTVLLSNNSLIVPRVDDYRVIGVSA